MKCLLARGRIFAGAGLMLVLAGCGGGGGNGSGQSGTGTGTATGPEITRFPDLYVKQDPSNQPVAGQPIYTPTYIYYSATTYQLLSDADRKAAESSAVAARGYVVTGLEFENATPSGGALVYLQLAKTSTGVSALIGIQNQPALAFTVGPDVTAGDPSGWTTATETSPASFVSSDSDMMSAIGNLFNHGQTQPHNLQATAAYATSTFTADL